MLCTYERTFDVVFAHLRAKKKPLAYANRNKIRKTKLLPQIFLYQVQNKYALKNINFEKVKFSISRNLRII